MKLLHPNQERVAPAAIGLTWNKWLATVRIDRIATRAEVDAWLKLQAELAEARKKGKVKSK